MVWLHSSSSSAANDNNGITAGSNTVADSCGPGAQPRPTASPKKNWSVGTQPSARARPLEPADQRVGACAPVFYGRGECPKR